MKAKALAFLQYWWSILAGGAAGALTSYFQQQGISVDLTHLDWHKLIGVAAMGAVTAFAFHLAPPPNSKPATKEQPNGEPRP